MKERSGNPSEGRVETNVALTKIQKNGVCALTVMQERTLMKEPP